MCDGIPEWALKIPTTCDLEAARRAEADQKMQIKWPAIKELRRWARSHGWRAPRFFFLESFTKSMLASKENFALALAESGVEIRIPRPTAALPKGTIQELDRRYDSRDGSGRPDQWGWLVAELRAIRRAVEANVAIELPEGQTLRSWGDFYNWAHGRYRALEDGYDSWIGDDKS